MRRPATVREIVLVLGVPMALSLAPVIRLALGRPMVTVFTDRNLLISLAIQAIIAACLLAYLSTRHWRPLDVAGTPELQDLGRGLALWLALIGIFYLVMLSLYTISPA